MSLHTTIRIRVSSTQSSFFSSWFLFSGQEHVRSWMMMNAADDDAVTRTLMQRVIAIWPACALANFPLFVGTWPRATCFFQTFHCIGGFIVLIRLILRPWIHWFVCSDQLSESLWRKRAVFAFFWLRFARGSRGFRPLTDLTIRIVGKVMNTCNVFA